MNMGGIKLFTLLVIVVGSISLVAGDSPAAECPPLSNDCQGCGSCFKVDENSPPGTCVGDLKQTPNDGLALFLSSNRSLTFNIQPGQDQSVRQLVCGSNVSYTDWFTIENSSIRTLVELDNEYYRQICGHVECPQVFMRVTDSQDDSLVFAVFIDIVDINDNKPEFLHTKSTNTTVFIETVEETTDIGQDLFCSDQLIATDMDTNQIITYSIIQYPPANFSYSQDDINQKLCIQNLSPLDRETTSNLSFILQAQDTGHNVTKTSNLTVVLILSDINDNLPIFVNPNVELSILENATPGSVITVFTATDDDVGLNAEISYSILSTSPVPFGINSTTGTLYVNGVLDADTSAAIVNEEPVSYSFNIVAEDGSGLSTELPVTVEIIDVNDNVPEFFKFDENEFSFAEGPLADNTVITGFNVFDEDYTPANWSGYVTVGGDYAEVHSTFTIIVNEVFRSNLLFNVDELDYETVQDIDVTFVISDGGEPPLTVSASVTIHITDVNDNPPNLTQTEFQISEQQELKKGMVLFMLRDYFQDLDSDLDGNNQPGEFIQIGTNPYVKVLPSVGTVQVEQHLDREENETISFQVMIFDMGNPPMSSTKTITIYLKDINDNAPQFVKPEGPFEIPEEQDAIIDFGHVMARDNDAGLNGTVTYQLTGNYTDLFSINSTTGYLSSLVQLDRETKSKYELTVLAEDMGKQCNGTMGPCRSFKIVTIIVTDVNDNRPIFDSDVTTSFSVNSTADVGSRIGRVMASDGDIGINAVINYTLDNATVFAIDDSGVISTVRELEAFDSGTYMLLVTAWNSENSQLNSTLLIEVKILQANSTMPTGGFFETMQLYGSIALAAFILIIAIAIVSCCICCLCYHRRHTQSKNLPPLPPQTTPRKSSLRLKMVSPTHMSQDDDPPINGDVPRSPTVNFSDECQVRYFSQDQSMTKAGGKTETVRFAESKFDDTMVESPQIPTKDVAPETEEISSPPLSEDMSSGSSLSNSLYHSTGAAAAGNQYYEHPPKNHHLPLREDTLKKHNEAISENYGGHGSMLYPPQGPGRHERIYTSKPYPMSNGHYPHGIVEDERNQYNGLPLPPDIQHYLSSNNHSDQSISVAVSHYVSQNGTPPSAESSPRIQFVHPHEPHPHHRMHGPPHTSAPAVYYSSHHHPPISPHYTMDQSHPPVYYDDPSHQKSGLQHYNSSSSSNSSHNIHRPDISPPSPPPQPSRYPPPVMPHPFPRHSRHAHERPPIDGHLSPLAEYPPPSHLMPHHSAHSRNHVSYTHPHPHMLPPAPSHLYSRGSFVSEGDNDTVASSQLDRYLEFDTHLPRPDYLLSDAISVDDR